MAAVAMSTSQIIDNGKGRVYVRHMLKEVLTPELVTTHLEGHDKRSVIQSLLELLAQSGKVKDMDVALRDLLEHEAKMSTGMENGIAIPHAKSDAVDELIAAIGVTPRKINFECLDRKPAQIFIMTLSPTGTGGPHVQFLKEIGRLLQEKRRRKLMLRAKTSEDLLAALVDD